MEDDQNSEDINIEGEKKIVVIGQNGCGKSSLIASFVSECPAGETKADPPGVRKTISFGRDRVTVVLREVQSRPNYPFTRVADYVGVSAAFVCFDFKDAKSIRSVPQLIMELKQFSYFMDLYVVGCKLDQKHQTAVSLKEWMDLEQVILYHKYLECSAETGEGVSHLVRMVGTALIDQQLVENPAVHA